MKRLLFICWMLVFAGGIQAQNYYDYDYDASGNRIRRCVVTLKTGNGPNMPDEQRSAPASLDDESLRLYPNPTRGTVVIETTDGKDMAGYRLSDTNGKRFFSPDPFVQIPDFTQSFNRYSYCMNNPVMYSDPDGESILATRWRN